MTGPTPQRPPLPEDPWVLPPPDDAWRTALAQGLDALGLDPSPGVHGALDAHSRLLVAWTEAINLTAVRTPEGVARLHLVDSLSAVPLLRRTAPPEPSILDLGSGGGMPGLPLGLALPASRIALVDSIAKKVRFLEVAIHAARDAMQRAGETPPRMEAIAARAEDLAARPDHRGAWGVVTARAVGTLAELVELGLPLLRPGGLLVCWKRDDGAGSLALELEAAAGVARVTGAGAAGVHDDPEAAIAGHRLVTYRKERATPDRYPRPPAERRRAG